MMMATRRRITEVANLTIEATKISKINALTKALTVTVILDPITMGVSKATTIETRDLLVIVLKVVVDTLEANKESTWTTEVEAIKVAVETEDHLSVNRTTGKTVEVVEAAFNHVEEVLVEEMEVAIETSAEVAEAITTNVKKEVEVTASMEEAALVLAVELLAVVVASTKTKIATTEVATSKNVDVEMEAMIALKLEIKMSPLPNASSLLVRTLSPLTSRAATLTMETLWMKDSTEAR